MSFYTLKDIEFFEAQIVERGLSVPDNWYAVSAEQKLQVANGIGPGAWSRAARKMSTALQPHAVLGAFIHDVGYCHPDKTEEVFDRENKRFYENIRKVVSQELRWYHPFRPFLYAICWVEYLAVSSGGWAAFVTGQVIYELRTDEGPEVSE